MTSECLRYCRIC